MNTNTPERKIKYNRESRDYDLFLDGRYVGSAATYHEAEVTLDQLVFELLSSGVQPIGTEAA